jgi:uncharacterized protein
MNITADCSVLPFNSKKIKNKYLVTNMMGCWDALNREEFGELNSLRVLSGGKLFDRLLKRGIIVDANNLQSVIAGYRSLNANLFWDTGLHIAVLTKGCNLHCTYCHAEGGASSDNMSLETATRVLQYLFDVKNKSVTLEFQGGEATMNWPVLKYLTENARLINKSSNKDLRITVVTNMLLLDDEKMKFLSEQDVNVCTSVDGPAEIHDKNRANLAGKGSHAQVMEKVARYTQKFGKKVYMLPTITKDSLEHPEKIIDEYIRLGQHDIALRPVNRIGYATENWDKIGYTAAEFGKFYDRALAYLMKINLKGQYMAERIAKVIMNKAVLKKDPGYVDMMTVSGAGRAAMAYATDGGCFPSDEARMLGDEIFRLGNINDECYSDMLNKDTMVHVLQAGYSDLWNYRSVYSPWLGVDPVVNYAFEKNIVAKVKMLQPQQVLNHQFDTVFSYLLGETKYAEVLQSWIQGEGHDRKKD